MSDASNPDRRDELVLERATLDDFQLVERESDSGQVLFEWRWGKRRYPGPEFVSRRHAIDWMAEYQEGQTPGHGIDRREMQGE